HGDIGVHGAERPHHELRVRIRGSRTGGGGVVSGGSSSITAGGGTTGGSTCGTTGGSTCGTSTVGGTTRGGTTRGGMTTRGGATRGATCGTSTFGGTTQGETSTRVGVVSIATTGRRGGGFANGCSDTVTRGPGTSTRGSAVGTSSGGCAHVTDRDA